MSLEVQFCKMERVLEMDGSDSYTRCAKKICSRYIANVTLATYELE